MLFQCFTESHSHVLFTVWWCGFVQGAQEMFRNLPHEYVDVAHLKKVAQHGS